MAWSDAFVELRYLSGFSWGYSSFLAGTGLLFLVGWLALFRLPRPAWRHVAFGWLVFGAAFYAVSAPGRPYPHYLLFLTLPLALAAGLQFGHLLRRSDGRPFLRALLVALVVVAGAGAQLAEFVFQPHSRLRLRPDPEYLADIVGRLDELKRPGDTLAVWGWRPELYVDTQLPQGVRVAETEREINRYPLTGHFRRRFLAEVQANRPTFLVDAVGARGFIFQDRAAAGLETFPELAAVVGRDYRLEAELDTFRLYVRRDRAPPAGR